MSTLQEVTESLRSLANARQHYAESPEDAAGFDSATIVIDLEVGINKAMKEGLGLAAQLMADTNTETDTDDTPDDAGAATAIGNFHVLRRNVLLLLNPPAPPEPAPPNRAAKRRAAKAAPKKATPKE